MLKNILNLEGALELTKSEQKEINGGKIPPVGLCDESLGSFATDISTCLCSRSTYNVATQSCEGGSGAQSLARHYNSETGCCTPL